MKVKLLQVGKTDASYLREGIGDYHSRLKHYAGFEEITIPDIKNRKSMAEEEVRKREGHGIMKYIRPADTVILLDQRGKQLTSEELAEFLRKKMNTGKDLVFIIGGPYGFSDEVYSRGDEKLALSKMTFSHQIVRLIFAEQLYRAMTIIRGEPYHHS